MKLVFACLQGLGLACLLSINPLVMPAVLALPESRLTREKDLTKQPQRFCQQDLATAIEEIINRPELERSHWGIEIQTLSGESLYSLDGDKFFNPASNAKLLVSAAGLLVLGADYRIKTPIYLQGNPPNLKSLRVKGQGDPTLSTQSLKTIAHQLQTQGVKQIDNLIIDDSYFAPPVINPTWEWEDVHSYFATAVNSAILNENTVTLTLLPQQIGQPVKFFWDNAIAGNQWQVINQTTTSKADQEYTVKIDGDLGQPQLKLRGELAVNEPADVWDLAIVDPGQYFLESLRFELAKLDITVTRGTVIEQETANLPDSQSTAVYSPSLAKILAEINQESNNLYAEVLGKILAKELKVATPIKAINQTLQQLGIKPDEYVLVDTSGLSRQNLVTPQTLVKVLQAMSHKEQEISHPFPALQRRGLRATVGQSYRQSLAIAGAKGTLKNRFLDTPVQNHFWGKTGTLTQVGALTGYLQTQANSTLVISILVNNSQLKNPEIRQAIDAIVLKTASFENCQ